MAQYQTLLSKLATNNHATSHQLVDWSIEDDITDMQGLTPQIRGGSDEPLVGNFAEAAKAA